MNDIHDDASELRLFDFQHFYPMNGKTAGMGIEDREKRREKCKMVVVVDVVDVVVGQPNGP